MKKCLNCQKEIEQKEGKREKQFCDDKCRASYWQKNKKKEPKYVQFKTFQQLKEKFDAMQNNDRNVQKQEVNPSNELLQIKNQIASIRAEKMPPHIQTSLGKKAWELTQNNRINNLLNQLQ